MESVPVWWERNAPGAASGEEVAECDRRELRVAGSGCACELEGGGCQIKAVIRRYHVMCICMKNICFVSSEKLIEGRHLDGGRSEVA
jgi:hypothetical protein